MERNWTNQLTKNSSFLAPNIGDSLEPYMPVYITTWITISYILVFVLGILGNLLVIIVVRKNVDMHTPTNVFLVNLSVADLLVIAVCTPSAMLELYSKDVWYLGDFMCRLIPFVEQAVAHASILTILCISFERYFAILRPMATLYTCTTTRALKLVLAVWIVTIVTTSPFLAVAHTEETEYYDGSYITTCRMNMHVTWKKTYTLAMLLVFFIIPFILVSLLYLLIMIITNQPEKRHIAQNGIHAVTSYGLSCTVLRSSQAILMLVIVVIMFFICLLPMKVVGVWILLSPKNSVADLGLEGYYNLLGFTRFMLYLNSAGNVVVYNLVSSKFQMATKRTLASCHLFPFAKSSIRSRTSFASTAGFTNHSSNHRQDNQASIIPDAASLEHCVPLVHN